MLYPKIPYLLTFAVTLALSLVLGLGAAQAPLELGAFHARVVMGGIEYSDNLLALEGERVELTGFMAPPLKPRIDWFMLTRFPMLTCPFCSDAADWPPDVVLVVLEDGRRMDAQHNSDPLRVIGRLELGVDSSVEAGLSLIRIYAERVERVR
jgi:hypothetical protein